MFAFQRVTRERTAAPATITVTALAAALRHNPVPPLLLDVREADEFAAGRIPGATLVPLGALQQRLAELPNDRPIACICRSGNRSGIATALLRRNGYDAVNMTGGMLAWSREGLPIERG